MKKSKTKPNKKHANRRPPKRRAKADVERTDRDLCSTSGCEREAVVTKQGSALCQACWERACQGDEVGTDATTKNAEPAAGNPKDSKRRTRTRAAKRPAQDAAQPKRLSALDAAVEVLCKSDQPMRSKELIAAMAEQGLWTSPNGKTPDATLNAAIIREIAAKGDQSRFKKVDRGQFAFNATESEG